MVSDDYPLCESCEDGEGRVFHEEDRTWSPCPVCGPMLCVSCLREDAGLDGLCARCARPATVESVCEQGRPVLDYPHGLSRLIEDRDGRQIEHVIPHYQTDDVLQQAVTSAFYDRTLAGDAA